TSCSRSNRTSASPRWKSSAHSRSFSPVTPRLRSPASRCRSTAAGRRTERVGIGGGGIGCSQEGIMGDMADGRQIVLVLQGGGALGAFQAGVYQALHEGGVAPDWIIGTSI